MGILNKKVGQVINNVDIIQQESQSAIQPLKTITDELNRVNENIVREVTSLENTISLYEEHIDSAKSDISILKKNLEENINTVTKINNIFRTGDSPVKED